MTKTIVRLTLILAVLIAITPAFAQSKKLDGAVSEEGDIGGAAFRIDIPENWNGGLVMYAHGYAVAGTVPQFNTGIINVANDLGYAIAQSKYTVQGWAAREGILDTEALRRYFAAKYGDTYPTIVAGHSQGAAITYATIERYPEVYDGALPMCGSGGSAIDFMKERVFDMRLLFDYFFPGLPGSVVDFPEGRKTSAKVGAKATELIKQDPAKAERFAQIVNLSGAEAIPGVIAFWSEILRELQERTGGNAFDNGNTIYTGTNDDVKLNREIPRYEADPEAVEYLREWVTLTGEISDPVLALHTMVDDLIPPPEANKYNAKTVAQNTAELYAMHYVAHVGHCSFTADEMKRALKDLTTWIKKGKKPTPSDITSD